MLKLIGFVVVGFLAGCVVTEAHAQTKAAAPMAIKLTTAQRSQWTYLQGLLRKFSEATDRGSREVIANEYLTNSRGFREVFPADHEYWLGRARMALFLNEDKAGREAAAMMAKINSPTPVVQVLVAQFRQRGWLKDGSEKSRLGGDFVIQALELQMVYVEPGTFVMGSTFAPNEGPLTKVTITHPFWFGKYEITRRHWRTVMGSDFNDGEEPGLPKVGVSWLEAMGFCERLTNFERAAGRIPAGYAFTLPTEAQWEYACRAGSDADMVSDLSDVAWFADNSGGRLHPIGEKTPNAWGIGNMLGNASEWCLDYYADNLPGGEQIDPQGPTSGTLRAVRGGNFGSPAANCRPAKRGRAFAEGKDGATDKVGFRIVLTRLAQ
ncbi:MAG TPA: formylglycine-generating enzyme family protein [Opitutaceae bacterium]